MKTAVTIADAANIENPRDDIFDIYEVYARTVLSDPVRQQETADRQGYFHPSALIMCACRNVYEARSEPFESHLGVPDLEIFELGHFAHDRVQGVLEHVDRITKPLGLIWTFEREVPYDPTTDVLFRDLRCGGTADGVLTIEKPGLWKQRGLLEVKSMKDEFWQEANEPKEAHRFQAHLYAFRFDCPIIWYWYYNKNNSRHRIHPESFDQEVFKQAVDRLEMFNEHLRAGTLPDREESWYFCQRCEYQKPCDPPSLKRKGSQRSGVGNAKRKRALSIFKRKGGK